MELQIYKPNDNEFLQTIEFNYEELKTELEQRLVRYKGLTYNDNEISAAKLDRATLNKFKDALEAKRKEVKNKCLEPYMSFEGKIKSLVALVDDANRNIDEQIKTHENAVKAAKRLDIEYYFDEQIGQLESIISFDKIFNEKWLNTTYNIKNIQKEIDELITKIFKDLQTIENLNSEYELEIKNKYLQAFSLGDALMKETELKALKKFSENKPTSAEVIGTNQNSGKPEIRLNTEYIKEKERLEFVVYVTPEQKQLLVKFLKENKFDVRRN